jgi:ferritin-like metal-binding protein YciE
MAKPSTMAELYTKELRDLYNAEQQILKALPKLIDAASHDELKDALEAHRRQTEGHVRRLEQIFQEMGQSPKGEKSKGIEGVLDEGSDLIDDDLAPAILDAGLISAAQRVEHYEMAAYGTVRTWAEDLGMAAHAKLLQATLDEEKAANHILTELATQRVNRDAEREVAIGRTGEIADTMRPRPGGSPSDRPRPSAGERS